MNLFLVNYRHTNSEPLKSITSIPFEEAKSLADNLYKNSSCKAHRRFGSAFAQYYHDRKTAEEWLYSNFKNQGGIPKIKNPLYFTLEGFEEFSVNYNEYEISKLDLNEISEEDVSFTLGDSMALYYNGALNQVLTKSALLAKLTSDTAKEHYPFIEAQLWNDKYFTK